MEERLFKIFLSLCNWDSVTETCGNSGCICSAHILVGDGNTGGWPEKLQKARMKDLKAKGHWEITLLLWPVTSCENILSAKSYLTKS